MTDSSVRPDFHTLKGRTLPLLRVSAERGQLQFFVSVLGLSDPVYTDVEAARAAGHPDLLIPPTFFFSLELKRSMPHAVLHEYGFDTRRFLHGEQSFDYHRLAYAGETLDFAAEYSDCYEKKGGALKFIERTTRVSRADEPVAVLRNLLVVREMEAVG
ncbi:FAS1-like dehydratase domain-containing protein [Brevibacterium atlanticum]|uniref:FAS1-like dehydratase domain-containing protein n=1 Tax=Brevibacterium atlanticum TaxID=2697563 RepID=UPI0014216EA0|nr:MaoC family dehydratase N-terminal domain-containing protein [Brevibacterium atlanticum]